MKKNSLLTIIFRFAIIVAFILLLSFMIVYNMFKTTVLDASKWNAKADSSFNVINPIPPVRGNILAADGSVLAANLKFYDVRVDFDSERFLKKRFLSAVDSLSDSLAVYFPKHDRAEWREILMDGFENRNPRYNSKGVRLRNIKTILRNIDYSQVEKLRTLPFFEIPNRNKTGLIVDSKTRRSYPYGDMAIRSIGYVGETDKDPTVKGRAGLEQALDSLLYGIPGTTKKVSLTRDVTDWRDQPAVPGYNVLTTIDIGMQDIVENELNRVLEACNAEWGVAILMEVATGDIKAISNLEEDVKGGTGKYIEAKNRALEGFEPGSVVKPISMMIALEDGLACNIDSVVPIGARWAYAGGRPITDSHFSASLTVRGIIEQSSNIGMARIITKGYGSNPTAYVERLRSIGFFDRFHSGMQEEAPPTLVSMTPSALDLSRISYGYASQIPPLYTLAFYNAMANGGIFVRPRLYSALLSEERGDSILDVNYMRRRICSEENAAKMRTMLAGVVQNKGTAKSINNDIVPLAGKTGTCYSVGKHGYDTGRKRLAFCGFFPADNPKYSCMVLVYHPRQNMFGAASTSGQVFKNIALKMFSRGMLDNSSDYRASTPDGVTPQYFASTHPDRVRKVSKSLNADGHSAAMPAVTPMGTVPDVKGLGLREAVEQMESRGYNISFSGAGYVRSQSVAPGTAVPVDSVIHLSLTLN